MTEKLFTETLNHKQNKTNKHPNSDMIDYHCEAAEIDNFEKYVKTCTLAVVCKPLTRFEPVARFHLCLLLEP